MASNISCPNCHEGQGKDKENPKQMHCGNCGEEWYNDYGYDVDEHEEER